VSLRYADLKAEYQHLWDSMIIRGEKIPLVDHIVDKLAMHADSYRRVAKVYEMPWSVVAAIHSLEAGGNFGCHLHNGDPLSHRTVHVPKGRPADGNPPFSWEDSAVDALDIEIPEDWDDWSIPGCLYRLEAYNGWGYRIHHPNILSPYLWSFSNLYGPPAPGGKFVEDGKFDFNAVSSQCGAAVILRRMIGRKVTDLKPEPGE